MSGKPEQNRDGAKTRPMTDEERVEIEEIQRRSKERFEAKLKELGPAFNARHPRLS